MSNLDFKLMSLSFKFRDFFLPRQKILEEVGIKRGFKVLDFGCGPGSYLIAASKLVGPDGKIYALDINPLAIKSVGRIVAKKHLKNVEIIRSDCKTELSDKSLDVVLLYDTFHELPDPDGVLKELHRILKPEGILSVSEHHLKENEIVSQVTQIELFGLLRKNKKTLSFSKRNKAT